MNVMQINSVCGIGSTGRISTDLHDVLVTKGNKSTISYGRSVGRNCSQTIHIGGHFSNYMHVFQTRFFDNHGFGSRRATEVFIDKINILNPDIIHLHNLHGYYLHIGLLFEYLKYIKKPVIWTLHDCWAFTGHCSHFDFIGCDRWKEGCYKCPIKSEYPSSFFIDNSTINYKRKKKIFTGLDTLTIVTPSIWLSNLVKESFLREYPVRVINNGIDLQVFQPTPSCFRERYNINKNFILLGVASIWSERKGYKIFLDIAKQLRSDEKIVLVGVNERQLKDLPKGIIGIAKTSNTKELAEIYSQADVFINPTLEDNYPTTNLEALACGTPVITFNSGGSSECLDDSCGIVVDRGDLSGMISAIETIKKIGKKSLTVNCKKRAIDLFDKNKRFAEYVELYEGYLA